MKKQDFAKQVAQRAELESTSQGMIVVDTVLEALTRELSSGNSIQFRGFGTFGVSKRKARTGRNPQTGAPLKIKAHKAVTFKAGTELKNAANSPHFGLDWLQFKDISKTVGDIKSKIETKIKNPDQIGKEAKQYLDNAQTLYEDAGDRLKKAADSGGKAWGEVKTGLDKALGELKIAWKKAKDSF
ncbi:HU family DNA-binding protein [Desulfovibrio ferrophilus]|uniref:Histone family protein DNA-binding protein n=1 Tax=Desulfovibrio ferrophilus TaxID=241368 RepID=A0A2Z6AWH0_9BACT|nr:HU family DNA-binding protein [Desulfovibrio ferrophilus]BBD07545.1 histone family protein DNA-binding protein [Desulfovibrio ferrophilus]